MRVDVLSQVFIAQDFYTWIDLDDEKHGTLRPLMADLATNLLGRDVLEDLMVVLATREEGECP